LFTVLSICNGGTEKLWKCGEEKQGEAEGAEPVSFTSSQGLPGVRHAFFPKEIDAHTKTRRLDDPVSAGLEAGPST